MRAIILVAALMVSASYSAPAQKRGGDATSKGGVRFVITDLYSGKIENVAQLEAIKDDLQSQLDSMSEMSEMTSLRLQVMMERRSRFVQMLSNMMKKMNDTASSITQNLK